MIIYIASFLKGLFLGIPFGVIFNIPKYGRIIVLVMTCAIGIYAITDPTMLYGFTESIISCNGAANLIGIIIGQEFGKDMLKSIIKEWVK